jgi:acyl-CoA dehydrogenase
LLRLYTPLAKLYTGKKVVALVSEALEMFGGAGYIADHAPIERWYRDVRLFRLYEGTSQIHQLNIAKLTLAEARRT